MVVGGQATKAAKNAKRFQRMVDRLDSKGHITQANRYLDAAKGRTTEPVKKGGYKLGARAAKGSWYLSKASGRRILSGAKTAGQQSRVAQKLSDANGVTLSKIDGFSERTQRKLGRALARGESPQKVADGGQNYVDLLDDLDDVDPQTARRLNKIERDGEDVAPLVRAYQNDEIDGEALRRASKPLGDTGGDQAYLTGDDVDPRDLVGVSEAGGDLSRTVNVVTRKGEVRWMEAGSSSKGRGHIKGRHIHGDLETHKETSFFPTGEEIVRGGTARRLDDKMSEEDVQQLINKAIKEGTPDEDDPGEVYVLSEGIPDGYDIDRVRVVIGHDGRVITAYPKGPNVQVWDNGWDDQ